MKKRIISLLLLFLMLISLIPISSVFAAGTTNIVISADKTTAYPDDIVDFTVSIGAVEHLMGAEFKVTIPTGITYVAGSASVADGIKTTLGCASADWTESSMKFTMYGDGDYSSDSNTKILTFSCRVDSNTIGSIAPQITDIVLSDTGFEEITIQVDDNAGTVNVTQRPVFATGVSLNKETLSLNTGENETLIATVNPNNASNKTVSWKSSDSAIATIDNNGKVTAIKKGSVTITVTTEDGSFTDTCIVSVACSHTSKSNVSEKASDCKNKGWDAYVKCDDCGQIFKADGTTEIAEIPFRPLSQQHTGGTATCTKQAVCTVCNQPYGNLAFHSYTAAEKKAEALKTAGNCRDKAVYWYSCSVCGKVENDDNHTFEGDKISTTHVGGTTTVNQSESNHNTQTDGYTGDTKCLGCNTIINYGQAIPAGAHTPANVWSTDAEYHWKDCQTVGCGNLIDKATHSGGTATCKNKAICSVCDVEYGTTNATNHAGETEIKNAVEATCTTDGYTGDTYCKDCGVKITDGKTVEAGHKTVKVAEVPATHEKDGNIEYYTCSGCDKLFSDEKATTEITLADTVIAKGEHNYGDTYENDADNHWKACGCGNVIEKAAHTFGEWSVTKEATETEKGSKEKVCSVCGYKVVEEVPVVKGDDTTNPDDSTDSGNSTNKDDVSESSPQTGDTSNMFLWIALLILSGTGLVITTSIKRKHAE